MAIPAAPDVTAVATSAGEVRVRDTGGDGPPLLLIHSLLLDGGLYDRLLPLVVAQGRRGLVPDLPLGAHSPAMTPDSDLSPAGLARLLIDVLDALAVDVVDVVGVDTGGALAQILMADHRDRVGRVVLTACDAYEAFPPPSFAFLLPVLRVPGALWLTGVLLRAVPGAFNLRMFTHAGVERAMARRWARPLRDRAVRRDLRTVLAGMQPGVTLAAAAANASFPRPVLVAWGEDDRVFPRRFGERLATDLPHGRLVTLPDCAAFAALDQPELLAGLLDEHLGLVDRPATPDPAPA